MSEAEQQKTTELQPTQQGPTEQKANQTTQPKRDFLAGVGPWADAFSKSVAGIAITVYACGFLIVSLYHAKFGFVGTTPFRPRVLAAGAWFLLFAAIPVSIALYYRAEPWSKLAENSLALWMGSYTLSMPLASQIFEFRLDQTTWPPGKWGWAVVILAFAAYILLAVLRKKKKVPQWPIIILSLSLTLYFVIYPARSLFIHRFDTSVIALWFFGTALVVKLEFWMRSNRKLSEDGEWSKPLVVLLGLLAIFSREIYPNLKASWGGGTPSNVTIYFTKDSLLNPSKATQSQLIEESDEGFYIVGPNESKAVFVPRGAVALMYFSDKAANSPLLQGIK